MMAVRSMTSTSSISKVAESKAASELWYRDAVVAAEKLAEVVEIWDARL